MNREERRVFVGLRVLYGLELETLRVAVREQRFHCAHTVGQLKQLFRQAAECER